MIRKEASCVSSLIAKSALFGQAPFRAGGLVLAEENLDRMVSVAGQGKALDKALEKLGLSMPAPNSCVSGAGGVIVWSGRDQAFLLGEAGDLGKVAAVTDQSDGWAHLSLEGDFGTVLARLMPVDLRGFGPGQALRAPLGHMQAALFCTVAGRVDLLVFRSMARTAWDEIAHAMQQVAARKVVFN
jgi:heterotetrameric sarcosine oxidase gamma subunit